MIGISIIKQVWAVNMASLSNALQSNLLAESIYQVTGEKPSVVNENNVTYIRFSPDQQVKVRAWVEGQLNAKRTPGAIKIEFEPVIYPLAIKKILPFIILLLVVGIIIGKRI
jgi:hypothetical protein